MVPELSVINQVTESLQSPEVDMMQADSRMASLKKELQDLRSERQWEKVLGEAKEKITVLIKEYVESLQLKSQN